MKEDDMEAAAEESRRDIVHTAEEQAQKIIDTAREEAKNLVTLAKGQRKRTVVMSIVCAGIVGLFIGHAVEVEADNASVERSRKNCRLVQNDRRDIHASLKAQSDRILGSEDGKKKPIKIKGTSLEEFGPLMRSSAKTQRKRSKEYKARIQNCNEEFKKRKPFFIF